MKTLFYSLLNVMLGTLRHVGLTKCRTLLSQRNEPREAPPATQTVIIVNQEFLQVPRVEAFGVNSCDGPHALA